MNVFESDLFSLTHLTAAVNNMPKVPGRIGALGLFEEQGITTTSVWVEMQEGKLRLVENSERGSTGKTTERVKRTGETFRAMHLTQPDFVMADEVQNVRAFGTESQLDTVDAMIQRRLQAMQRNLEATMEWHRSGAIQGKVMDADGTTVITDLFAKFGLTQQSVEVDFAAASTDFRTVARDIKRKSTLALGTAMTSGFRALCGIDFFTKLTEHANMKAAWDRWQEGEMLRNDPASGFVHGGVLWEEYDGIVGDKYMIPANEAYLIPEGVPGLFLTRFAPADYMETVNTMGLPYYSDADIKKKGASLEVQSNPLHLCTVPRAVIKLTIKV